MFLDASRLILLAASCAVERVLRAVTTWYIPTAKPANKAIVPARGFNPIVFHNDFIAVFKATVLPVRSAFTAMPAFSIAIDANKRVSHNLSAKMLAILASFNFVSHMVIAFMVNRYAPIVVVRVIMIPECLTMNPIRSIIFLVQFTVPFITLMIEGLSFSISSIPISFILFLA